MTDMKQLSVLAEKQQKAQDLVAEREAELAKATSALRYVAETELPELMAELRVETFTTDKGMKITITEKVRAAITKANADRAYTWLVKNGHSKLIKRTISLVARDEERAQAVRLSLAEWADDVSDKPSIHNSTLVAFVKERLEAGADLPLELFGVHKQRIAKIEM